MIPSVISDASVIVIFCDLRSVMLASDSLTPINTGVSKMCQKDILFVSTVQKASFGGIQIRPSFGCPGKDRLVPSNEDAFRDGLKLTHLG